MTITSLRTIVWIGLIMGAAYVAVQHSSSNSSAASWLFASTATSSATTTTMNEDSHHQNNHRQLWQFQFLQKKNTFHTKHERNSPTQDAGPDITDDRTGKVLAVPTVSEVKKRLHDHEKNHRDLRWNKEHTQALPHQFLHLHHMKTGGTSTDGLLRCAMRRFSPEDGEIPYNNLHECSHSRYERCVNGEDQACANRANSSAIMSYCAPLSDLKHLGWKDGEQQGEQQYADIVAPDVDKMTVLRHPVDRVWSMYRFQTKPCYACRPLLDIYKEIDHPEDYADSDRPLDAMCKNQLLNHQVRNLRTNSKETSDNLDKEAVEEAIHNLYTSFTMIGLTSELPTTALMMGKIWPWLAENVNGKECKLPHANASPSNNRCGADGKSHLDLGDQPDEETRRVIEEHNQLDLELYKAGVAYFDVIKKALDIDETDDNYDATIEKAEQVEFDLDKVKGALEEARQHEKKNDNDGQ